MVIWENNGGSVTSILEHLAHRLTLLTRFEHLSFNCVLPVLGSKSEEWVLKINVPHNEFSREFMH